MGVLAYIGGLLLASFVGWGVGKLLSLPGQASQDRKQKALIRESLLEFWQWEHPGESLPDPVRKRIDVILKAEGGSFKITGSPATLTVTRASGLVDPDPGSERGPR